MKLILKDNNILVIRFDKSEEVVTSLAHFCAEQNIQAASFSAIGAAQQVVISYYNMKSKQYQDMEIHEDVEIVGVLGNVATMNGKTLIHCHGSFSDEKFVVKAGHIKKLVVSATCEVTITVISGNMEREYDEQTGLNLLQ